MRLLRSLGLSEPDISPGNRRRLSGPGLRAFLRIAEQWRLSPGERARALGIAGSDFLRDARAAADGAEIELPVDVLLRLSAILGIHAALTLLFDEAAMLDWLNGAHDAPWSGGRRPRDIIASGDIGLLLACRRHLDQLCR